MSVNPNYFFSTGDYRVPQVPYPQIEHALLECEALLKPIAIEQLRQIIARLFVHFSLDAGKKECVSAHYMKVLQSFPEDLLCAAYQHALKHHESRTLPKITDFIAFMEPEMTRRLTSHCKLMALLPAEEMAGAYE